MFELPNELRIFNHQNQTIEFSYGLGEVIKVENYVKTLIKGGGGRISTNPWGYTYGEIQSVFIESQSIDVLDIWIKSEDGREVNCQLFNPNIGVREGHRVVYFFGKGCSIEPPITVSLMDMTLGDGYSMHVGKAHFLLQDNPSGFFKNPKKKQDEFEEIVHKHCMKILNHATNKHG